jgi:hypothetical protein
VLAPGNTGNTGATGPAGATGAGAGGVTGIAFLNFGPTGAAGSNFASVTVTGQASITSTATPTAFLMADSTADHNDMAHIFVDMNLRCGNVLAATGFTIYGTTDLRLTGQLQVRWNY